MGNRIYLASPTMHQEEQVFIQEHRVPSQE